MSADSGGKQRPHVGGSYGTLAGNLALGYCNALQRRPLPGAREAVRADYVLSPCDLRCELGPRQRRNALPKHTPGQTLTHDTFSGYCILRAGLRRVVRLDSPEHTAALKSAGTPWRRNFPRTAA